MARTKDAADLASDEVGNAPGATAWSRAQGGWSAVPRALRAIDGVATAAIFSALLDAAHVTCPKCGAKPPIRPWSF
jgi:hypothetical protein